MTGCICQHRYQDSEYVRPCKCNLWSAVIRQCSREECGLSDMIYRGKTTAACAWQLGVEW